jgi:hypothetical protein
MVYIAFIIINLLIAILLLVGFMYNLFQVVKKWNLTIQRHKFFLVFSFYFIMIIFFLIASGVYQSFEKEGVKILVLFITCNAYIFIMQYMWMFDKSNEFYQVANAAESPQNKAQKMERNLGMKYFQEDYEVEVKSQNQSQNLTMNSSFDKVGLTMDKQPLNFGINANHINSNPESNEKVNLKLNFNKEAQNLPTNEDIRENKRGSDTNTKKVKIPLGKVQVDNEGEKDEETDPEDESKHKHNYDQFDEDAEPDRDDLQLFEKYRNYDPSPR